MMQIGRYRVRSLLTGRFGLDGGAMFGVVPRVLWERHIPADEKHRIPLALRSLLLESDDRTILVDTGIGSTKWSDKERAIYAIDHSEHELLTSLAALGVAPGDVTDVLLTHLHFDHAGGATTETTDGALVPTFPSATYYLQRRNLAWAEHPTEKDQASYLERDFGAILARDQLVLLDGAEESPFEDVTLYISDGHTEGQQLPIISDGTRTVMYCGDLIPTRVHVPVPWVMGYDIRPLQTMEEKKEILRKAVDEGWILAYEHDPDLSATTVLESERGFASGESVAL